MAQKCQRCKRPLEDNSMVWVKCPAVFEQFSDGVHRIVPQDVQEIWCEECEYEDGE